MQAIPFNVNAVEAISLLAIVSLFAIGAVVNLLTDSRYARAIDKFVLLAIVVTCFIAPWVGAIFLVLLLAYVWYVTDYTVLCNEPNMRPSEHYKLVFRIFLQQLIR